jgi:hypothetical protein
MRINNYSNNGSRVFTILLLILSFLSSLSAYSSVTVDPAAADYKGRKGTSIYVSKLGNNSDGSSWKNAYHTIQAALSAVPDDKGGHIIIIRPDTYVEANLHPSHKGADGSYNLLVGDFDGSLGSGASGWVIIDSSTPEIAVIQDPVGLAAGEGNAKFIIVKEGPKAGFKSVDWWAPWRTGLGNNNDAFGQWIFRNLYTTGSEAGMYFERDINAPIIVENCVGIGRAFAGGGAGKACYRDGKWEPTLIFRRCYFMCLDWWGDAGGVAIAGSDTSMPEHPGVIFEDCTIVSPDNAVQVLNPSLYVRVKFKNCRMIVLNFSQPRGTPSSGIICCDVADSKYLHVDLEDCILMGFKVFGTGKRMGKISYTTKGKVQAYLEYEQSVPDGFERLGLWPKELFDYIAVPEPGHLQPVTCTSVKVLPPVDAEGRPLIKKLGSIVIDRMENSIIVFKDKVYSFYARDKAQFIERNTGRKIELPVSVGGGLDNAFVDNDTIYITTGSNMWVSTDMEHWKKREIEAIKGFGIFNTSICKAEDKYVLMFEIDKPKEQAGVAFTARFATSKDMRNWTITPPECNYAKDRYTAPHCLRYLDGYFYNFYLESVRGYEPHGHGYETCVVRSKDLIHWERSPFTVLSASQVDRLILNPNFSKEERQKIARVANINNSDIDMCEYKGQVLIQYAWGDQSELGDNIAVLAEAVYDGTMEQFLRGWFPEIKNYLPRVDSRRYYNGYTGVSSALSDVDSSTTNAAIIAREKPALCNSDVVFMGPADNSAYKAYGATFTAWGGANTVEEVKRHHDLGIVCTGSMWCLTAGAEMIHNDLKLREACCRDIEGNPVEVPWLFDQTYMGTKSYWGCTNNPVYWELCRQRVRQAMAGKADGLHIDDYMGVASSAWFHGGGLCDHCITMFGKYLKQQATKEQLIAAGVEDPDTFDYRNLIRKYAKTREEYMKVQKKIPLMDLFLEFHMQKVMEHVRELGELAEEVAGHPVLLSVNGNPCHKPHSYMTKCVTHFVCEVGQSASAGISKISEAVESYKAAERLGKPMAATAAGQDWAYVKEHQCEELVRFWIALAYAHGQRFMVPDPKNQWCFNEKLGTHWYAAPIEAYAPLYQFIRTNAGWFDNFTFIEGEVEAPDNVLCTIRQKGKMGPVVLHLLNLNYNKETKQMQVIKNLDISIRKSIWGEALPDTFATGQIKHARILSYDKKEQIVPIIVEEGKLTVKLPSLGLWSMVVLE